MYEYQAYGENGLEHGIRLYGVDENGNDLCEDYTLKDNLTEYDVAIAANEFFDDPINNDDKCFFEHIKKELCLKEVEDVN
jgi:hypothetical protein